MATTKLMGILNERKMNYREFQILLYEKTGYYLGTDRISKIATGKQKDILASTAKKIAEALEVKLDEVV
jgi:DNA-binding Xre family transcriptional regulator